MALVTIEQVRDALNLGSDETHDDELELYIDAATQHVEARTGPIPAAEITETVWSVNGTVIPRFWPILAVDSIENDGGSTYDTDFLINPSAISVRHLSVGSGEWTLTYTAGFATVPADLLLAVLEDIRGLYQPGQIGPPSVFGAFGQDSTDTGPTYRPVRMWPRVDAWLSRNLGPVLA